MLEKLKEVQTRYDHISQELAKPDVINSQEKYIALTKEHSDLQPIVEKAKVYIDLVEKINEDREILKGNDEELIELVNLEIDELVEREANLQEEIKIMLLPKDPNDDKNVIIELRAGTGGDEAALFVSDLFRMYTKYAEIKRWKFDILQSNKLGIGGFKEVSFELQGQGAYGTMKFESGVHRVQRVPETETQGRVHTSAATVAVLPEADKVDIDIDPKDLKIDTYRASGAGGQHVNKTESAIRITHLPTNLVVTCQDEKSQHKNKEKAMKILSSRLLAIKQEEQQKQISAKRKMMVGSGDRSAKIRTYNFPQGRVTDHRINLTLYKLDAIMEGEIDEILNEVKLAYNMELLKSSSMDN
ncbi:MAG: peptide chain release factor 1 [Candidatus Marinimicrobia bacterium]|nr:peptide chain release factor 1 [Candidatus Neomarinimicrobiota bacterium]